jgi:SAM-dependent methyltransferase
MRKAAAECQNSNSVLDIGCFEGEFLKKLPKDVQYYGIDPEAPSSATLVRGYFPADMPASLRERKFDVIVALAVVEHLETEQRIDFYQAARDMLTPGGKLVITIPGPFVDHILEVLAKLKLIDGMDLEHHHGASVADIENDAQLVGFATKKHKRFELGLNHLFVFSKD